MYWLILIILYIICGKSVSGGGERDRIIEKINRMTEP